MRNRTFLRIPIVSLFYRLGLVLYFGVVQPAALRATDDPEPPKDATEVRKLFDKLRSKEEKEREPAFVRLRSLVRPRHLRLIASTAKDEQAAVRLQAVHLLGQVRGWSAQELKEEVLPVVLRLLRDKDVRVRAEMVVASVQFGSESKTLRDRLIELLEDHEECGQSGTIASRALTSLARSSHRDPRVAALVAEKSRKAHPWLRTYALVELGRAAQASRSMVPKVLPILATVLGNPKEDSRVRLGAASGLAWMGKDAKCALPAIRRVLRSPRIQEDEQAALLRTRLLGLIGSFGQDAKDAVADVAAVVEDSKASSQLRSVALRTLEKLGPTAKPAVRSVEKAVKELRSRAQQPTRENLDLYLLREEAERTLKVLEKAKASGDG